MHDPYQTQKQQRGHMEGDEDRVKQSQANQDKLRCGARGLMDCRAKDKVDMPEHHEEISKHVNVSKIHWRNLCRMIPVQDDIRGVTSSQIFLVVLTMPRELLSRFLLTNTSEKISQCPIVIVVYLELCSDSPRFLDGTSRHDVVGWWATTLREAFRAFHEEFAVCSQGEHGVDAPAATAIVALVHERYLVIGNCGASKAVLSRDGELVELSSDSEHMANRRRDENKSVDNAGGVRVAEATSKLTTAPRTTTGSSVSSVPAPAAAADVVDVVAVEWEACDEFLILGSAALWDTVTPRAACAHVRRRLGRTSRVTMPWETRITDAEGSPTLLAEELAKKAVHAGSWDNVSVGLVVFRDFWAAGCTQSGSNPQASLNDEGPSAIQDPVAETATEETAGASQEKVRRSTRQTRPCGRYVGPEWQ
ncbi:unnamed protein product [Miscanthus lutarioriparius]|uniref:protein-serine/threonine phosphatase n=1 Tax=Miscanthus lutarioriparius TaxID=422564 RepID=A0A811NYB1_9POAL|nr:unnamed protein product [Miscanthus lutarioriparius]